MGRQLVVFEGINGCGKSTVAKRVAEKLGNEAVLIRNPTEGPIGTEVRKFIAEQRAYGFPRFFSQGAQTMEFATALAVLFTADRLAAQSAIEGLLGANKVVLCDRYALSTLVYQCAMVGEVTMDGPLARMILQMHAGVTRPDQTLVFDVPVDVAKARLAARGENNLDDRMMAPLEAAARSMYLDAKPSHGGEDTLFPLTGDIQHINADRPIDEVVRDAIDWINQIPF